MRKDANGDEMEGTGKPVDPALVARWFKQNPNPKDSQVHQFAEAHGYNPHELETVIYRAATQHYKSAACRTPGKKLKSKGKGRGEARGKGEGPLGIPIGKKKEKKMKKSAAYELGVELALEDTGLLKQAAGKGQKLQPGSLKGGKSEPASKAKAGSGGRFKAMVSKLRGRKGVKDPKALAAAIGRAKFGKGKMQSMAAHGH